MDDDRQAYEAERLNRRVTYHAARLEYERARRMPDELLTPAMARAMLLRVAEAAELGEIAAWASPGSARAAASRRAALHAVPTERSDQAFDPETGRWTPGDG